MNYLSAAKRWALFSSKTAFYGTISVSSGAVLRRRDIGLWCMRRWCESSLDGLGIDRSIVHPERLQSAPQCVFVSNHLSQLDILLIGSYMKRDYRWLAKASLFKVPFLGWHLSQSGHIPVYRGKQREKNKELSKRIHEVVEQGASLLFFPEGTRSVDGRLQHFHIGAFMTAVEERLPVVPLVVRGTNELLVKGAIDLSLQRDARCSLTVLDPVYPQAVQGEPIAKVARQLRDRVHALYERELAQNR